jgi:anti-anti-sigma regulatory factor
MTGDSGISMQRVGEHVWVMTAPGERDLADASALRDEVDRVYAMGSTLVFDLSETTFIDSQIVSVIAHAAERSRQAPEHGLIVVAPPTSRPRRVLDMVGAAQFAWIVDDLQTALDASPMSGASNLA